MAIPSKQIGWSNESNLLWYILKQLNQLTSFIGNLITLSTPKYKVFTALLTQSGSANSNYDQGFPLIIGQSYQIYSNDGSGDFINVGAPNNNVGTWFIATGTMPDSWGIEGEVTLFYDAGAPTAIVLENTIGNIWFTYGDQGSYYIFGDFVNGKTITSIQSDGFGYGNPISYIIADNQVVRIFTSPYGNDTAYILLIGKVYDFTGATILEDNGRIKNVLIEIRVYN